MYFRRLFYTAMLAIAAMFMTTVVALASSNTSPVVQAAATTTLNVRTGPSTSYGVIDSLDPGELVEVGECASNGWCYIYQSGPNGWVSSNFLAVAPAAGGSGGAPDPNCSLSLTINSSGTPSLTLNCGSGGAPAAPPPAPPAPPAPPPVGDQACFYTGANFSGAEFCYGVGTLNSLNATFNDRISSVRLDGAARARICRNTNQGGGCRLIASDVAGLGGAYNNRTSSLKVFVGAAPVPVPIPPIPLPIPIPVPAPPVTHSSGLINLQQTFTANLDNGAIGGGGVDIWYRAVTAANKFISPRNGALLALGDGSNRGFAGCSAAIYSAIPISIWVMPVGTYVCVKTSQGRISQFRLNGYAGTTMKLGYTTWGN
jgi:SH3 domain-containing protein/peptidase inhibitor family I36